MNKLKNIFLKSINIIISIFSIISIGYLTILSFLSTSYIDNDEHTYYLYDNPFLLLSGILIILVIGIILYRLPIKNKIQAFTDKYKKPFFIFMLAFAALLVLCTLYAPRVDQNNVLAIAKQLRNHNFAEFRKGGYVYRFSNQIGIITFFYFLSFITGGFNYISIQLINVIALGISVYLISKLAIHINETKFVSNLTMFFVFLFLPLTYYITFVYGNLIGLAFSLISIDLTYKYFETKKIRYILTASLMISLAVIIKSNYLITLVALVIFLIIDSIKAKNLISLIMSAVMIFCCYGANLGVVKFIENKTGYELNYGCPSISWVAMGLLESPRAEGWFNFFNWDTYENNDCNVEITKEKSYESIKQSIEDFKSGKRDAVTFFSKKMASQWNNPTFQGIYIQQNRDITNQSYSLIYQYFFSHKSTWQYNYLNFLQSLILFFALIYFLSSFSIKKIHTLLPAVIFIGGFIFHIFWEAKCQYTLPYFILLFPYATAGYKTAIIKGSDIITAVKNKNIITKKTLFLSFCPVIVVICLIIVFAIFFFIPNKVFAIGGDEEKWNSYSENYNKISEISDGFYNIKSLYKRYYLSLEEISDKNGVNVIVSPDNFDLNSTVYISTFEKYSRIVFDSTNLSLDVSNGSKESGANIQQWKHNYNPSQKFTFEKINDTENIYIIRYLNDLVLTFDVNTNNVYVDKYKDSINQKWIINEIKP